MKNILKGFALFSFFALMVGVNPAMADNSVGLNGFLNAQTSIKSSAFAKLENSTGVVMAADNTISVVGAKVVSVSGADINASASFGASTLSFVAKTDAETKLNGKVMTNASLLSQLKAGDKISFSGDVASSTNTSTTVNVDRLVSRTLFDIGRTTNETVFNGEVSAVNTADNSFTLKLKNGVNVKVALTGSTAITVDKVAKTLSALAVGYEVKVTGQTNADGTVISASKISAESETKEEENDNDNDNEKKESRRNRSLSSWLSWLWR